MLSPTLRRRLFWAAEALLLAGVVGVSVVISRQDEWSPAALVALLAALAMVGQWFSVEIREGELSASLIAIVLAMDLLGPVPAAALAGAAMILKSALRRLEPAQWLNNLATFAVFPFVGGLLVRALAGDVHDIHNRPLAGSLTFALIVLGVFVLTLVVSFVMFAADVSTEGDRSIVRELRELVPLIPGERAAGTLATILAIAYTTVGLPALLAAMVILLIFQRLTVALVRSEDRADQLQARSIQLASLQFGVLSTLMNALALRDRTAARHATAVARYAKALAVEADCSEEEQELIHTAGLLHDIGKFTWPDRVLHPERLTDEDMEVIHRHPYDGATLVGKLDGYGPVADAILYHHERIDGAGYPAGLIGNEIPLASRIVAICSTYDAMIAQDTLTPRMSSADAIAELRRIAGGQLDAELVELFIELLKREGPNFAHVEDADFETEFAFERRVQTMAQPTSR
jgi:putative nucleotidyltransferase with HDIG domain